MVGRGRGAASVGAACASLLLTIVAHVLCPMVQTPRFYMAACCAFSAYLVVLFVIVHLSMPDHWLADHAILAGSTAAVVCAASLVLTIRSALGSTYRQENETRAAVEVVRSARETLEQLNMRRKK